MDQFWRRALDREPDAHAGRDYIRGGGESVVAEGVGRGARDRRHRWTKRTSAVESCRQDSRAAQGVEGYGTKDVFWKRLVHEEAKLELKSRGDEWLKDRAFQLQQGMGAPEIHMPKTPEQPSLEERRRHEATH